MGKKQTSIKDTSINFILFCGGHIRKLLKIKKRERFNNLPILIKDDFSDDIWRSGQYWGDYHPDFLYTYYGNKLEGGYDVINNELYLYKINRPKNYILESTNQEVTIPYCAGLVITKKAWRYAYFEADITFPNSPGMWTAFWLTAVDSWPPEIDILEGYSDMNSDYKNKTESNLHFGIIKTNQFSSSAISHPLNNILGRHTYGCLWTPEFIKIYYDGWLVRVITDKKTIEWYSKEETKMRIVLNTGMRKDMVNDVESQMVVHSYKVCSYNGITKEYTKNT